MDAALSLGVRRVGPSCGNGQRSARQARRESGGPDVAFGSFFSKSLLVLGIALPAQPFAAASRSVGMCGLCTEKLQWKRPCWPRPRTQMPWSSVLLPPWCPCCCVSSCWLGTPPVKLQLSLLPPWTSSSTCSIHAAEGDEPDCCCLRPLHAGRQTSVVCRF